MPNSNSRRNNKATASSSSTSTSTSNNNKLSPEIKILCMFRIPRRELERLIATYPNELQVEKRTMDARTKFRKLHGGVDVSLELTGYPSLLPPDQQDERMTD